MYRKFTADQIFSGYGLLPADKVVISDQDGFIIDITDTNEAGDGIEHLEGLLCPGFINAHCHIELSHLKGIIPEKTGLVEFVQRVMSNRGVVVDAEQKRAAMKDAVNELYNSGTVAIGDICNTTDSIAVKADSRLQWHNFIETSGFVDAFAANRLAAITTVLQAFHAQLPGIATGLSPHAPYSVSKKLFEAINQRTAGALITIHNQETRDEDKLYMDKSGGFLSLFNNFNIDISSFEPTGKSSLESWLPFFNQQQSIIAVHNTFMEESDIAFAQKATVSDINGIAYCICANANRYIEGAMPPLKLLREKDCTILLGTDSYASNNTLNILEEIKTIESETGYAIPLPEILKWATLNGARALRMNDRLGSFEKGKQPGFVLVNNMENGHTTSASRAKRIH